MEKSDMTTSARVEELLERIVDQNDRIIEFDHTFANRLLKVLEQIEQKI
jgi:hypothetical protein